MWITHSSPLLHAIDQVQLATTYAWSSNDPTSNYYEMMEDKREQYLRDMDKACRDYLGLRASLKE